MEQVYMLKDVARLSGQSIHTVKFYLKVGLLKEIGRTPQTRFRYFDDSTIEALQRIRAWRRAGNSLEQIKALVLSSEAPATPLVS